jgi:hypothetical protein
MHEMPQPGEQASTAGKSLEQPAKSRPAWEDLPLSKAAQLLLEECRMVLPGIQALFGFQLIVVFNSRFAEALSPGEQRLHLLAIGLVMLAIALIMSPAAYHRQNDPQQITTRFIRVSTRLVLWSMPALALSLCVEFYLICRVIIGSQMALVLAAVQLGVCSFLWFVVPRLRGK